MKKKNTKKQKEQVMEGLFDSLLEYYTDLISSGERLSAGELSAMQKLLAENSINADFTSVEEGTTASDFLRSLPFLDEE